MGVEDTAIRTCGELAAGDEIEAWHNGKLFHRGRVTQTIPLMELFWILDARTGARKLLDVEALEIVRCAPAAGLGSGLTAALAQPA
ncbi:hypothetical protein [uncultured Arthrobacter sp.]|uniref:hypothetical protein n=1 Tax=uncultured Arthrobacter sp. TaxID=114050 RepID=UPI0032175BCC